MTTRGGRPSAGRHKALPGLVFGVSLVAAAAPAWGALTVKAMSVGAAPVGQPVMLRAQAQGGAGPVMYQWDFGDGTMTEPSASSEASHTYERPGHFPVIVFASDGRTRRSDSFIQTVHWPLPAAAPRSSSSIIVDARRGRVWSVNPDNDTVTCIDGAGLTRLFEVPVGKHPRTLAQAPDGTIWVVNQKSWDISVLDPEDGRSVARLPLRYASRPFGIAFAPDGSAGYVTLQATGEVARLDPVRRKVERTVAVGPTPTGIAVTGEGRVLVTRFVSPVDRGEVQVLDGRTLMALTRFDLAFDPGPDGEGSGRGVPNFLSSVVVSPDGRRAWIPGKKDNTARGPLRDGQDHSFDTFTRAMVTMVDLGAGKEELTARLDLNNRALPVAVAFTPRGDFAFVLAQASNWIGVMDAYTGQTVAGIREVGLAPDGLALAPDGKLFVNGFLSRSVLVYDATTLISATDFEVPKVAEIPAVSRERLPEAVLVGKRVFYNADDPRMSQDGYISCAVCHLGGFQDGRVWDLTNRGEGLRNTQSLLGRRGVGHGRLHWSANFDEVQDFERDIRESFGGTGFLPDEVLHVGSREDPFGDRKAGLSPELDGLAAYLESLNEVNPSPYRNPDGSFTAEARAGRKVFVRAGCATCHGGPDFTDRLVHDVGTLLPTSGKRLGGKLDGIDTPTLKGVWETAPYLHDGRAETLMDIFTKHNPRDELGKTSDLTRDELEQLVAYVQQLDDTSNEVPGEADTDAPGVKAAGCAAGGARSGGGVALLMVLALLVAFRKVCAARP